MEFAAASIRQYDRAIIPDTETALQATEAAYEVGRLDFNTLLTAQTDLLESRLERLDLLRQYHQSRAILAELNGVPYER